MDQAALDFTTRDADIGDAEFLYQLKKLAEREAVERVFGWDEKTQRRIHLEELSEAYPIIFEVAGRPVGSYLFAEQKDHFYFGRFFLLPELQGKGLGSVILAQQITLAEEAQKPIRLCYLRGNKVASLYQKFGFEITREDPNFVYMERAYLRSSKTD